jgi:phosphoglycerate dehydrogenase-like enzyme
VSRHLRISVPSAALRDRLAVLEVDAEVELWDLVDAPPAAGRLDLVVPPYMSSPALLRAVAGTAAKVVQSQSIGYDGVGDHLPADVTYCNAAGVHEASTAELAVGLAIASLRGLPAFIQAQQRCDWASGQFESLADKRVVVIGYGGVGRAVVDRLNAFELDNLAVIATRRRRVGQVLVHGQDETEGLLRQADVVVLALPLTAETSAMVDATFLAYLRPGALLVNVSRGSVVDTNALVRAVRDRGIRAALDVTDPEPLPPDHPLWQLSGVLITPHVGGNSSAMAPRMARLIRAQVERLVGGRAPTNIVIQPVVGDG